jgi:hypothetical protein
VRLVDDQAGELAGCRKGAQCRGESSYEGFGRGEKDPLSSLAQAFLDGCAFLADAVAVIGQFAREHGGRESLAQVAFLVECQGDGGQHHDGGPACAKQPRGQANEGFAGAGGQDDVQGGGRVRQGGGAHCAGLAA